NGDDRALPASWKIGCFRKLPNCPPPTVIQQAQLSNFVGVSVDTTQSLTLSSVGNNLKCKAGTQLALWKANELRVNDWWITCDSTAFNGWRFIDASGMNESFDGAAVACVKPTCTGMVLFDGTESLLTSNPNYQLVKTTPT
ncbi:hypothetical protein PENTCL1PPCAC_3771, partial [Pristionchus entomophagus]